jgi:cation diffusion facilitator CzcD-associated flavoprotein CzcO
MATPLRIAIIGAGSAGLAMAQQVVEAARMLGSPIGFVIFERRGNVGGIWQHDADVKPGYLAWESEQASLIPATAACKDARRLRYAWEEEVGVGPMFEGESELA